MIPTTHIDTPVRRRSYEKRTYAKRPYPRGRLDQAILNYIAKAGPNGCTFAHLYELFGDYRDGRDYRHAFLDNLRRLTDNGWLAGVGQRPRRWAQGPRGEPQWPEGWPQASAPAEPQQPVGLALPEEAEEAETAAPAAYAGQIVPPRRTDVMFGPVYRPQPHPVARPGAMDFKTCASRGHAC